MGLDQYLYRMPRYKNTTAKEVNAIEGYLGWLKAKKEGDKYSDIEFYIFLKNKEMKLR